MLRMIAFLLLFSLFCSEVSAADYDMGKLIGTDCAVFRMKPDEFLRSNRLFFKWTSSQKDTARYPAFPNSPRSAFLGFRVYEAIATFQNETLIRFYLSLSGKKSNLRTYPRSSHMDVCAELYKGFNPPPGNPSSACHKNLPVCQINKHGKIGSFHLTPPSYTAAHCRCMPQYCCRPFSPLPQYRGRLSVPVSFPSPAQHSQSLPAPR